MLVIDELIVARLKFPGFENCYLAKRWGPRAFLWGLRSTSIRLTQEDTMGTEGQCRTFPRAIRPKAGKRATIQHHYLY